MSRGILIVYKLIGEEDKKVTYGYSGANINKQYNEEHLLEYDGIIEIRMNALKNKTLIEAFSANEINILKECRYEWHQPRLTHEGISLGFFAVKVVSKIFNQYKENLKTISEGTIAY